MEVEVVVVAVAVAEAEVAWRRVTCTAAWFFAI